MASITKLILTNKRLSIKERIKKLVFYLSRKRGAIKSWGKRHEKVIAENSEYAKSINNAVEDKHRSLWSPFRNNIDCTTLRICSNISGISDPNIVPEDILVSDIEPSLIIDSSVNYLSNKSFYNRWFQEGIFPRDILHCIEGQYYDKNFKRIDFTELKVLAKSESYPVVLKPNRGTYGGKGINFVRNSEELVELAKKSKNYVVQEKINQHSYFKNFNPVGLNTVRVYIYESVVDNKLHILNMTLRMGKGGSLDNETAGGIHSLITDGGTLNGYAVDKCGTKYYEHPDSGLKFDSKIPNLDGLKKLATFIGNNVFLTRVIGLDACYDEKGRWRAIEINTKAITTRFSQYGGKPFFGKFTNEVVDYCLKNHWTLE